MTAETGMDLAGFYPFWFWNGKLEPEEIRRQIAEMAEQQVKGFYIHSRQGLYQPYLSESFFQMVDVAVETAEKYGLTVCLYDEYPYPSGIGGGEVVLGSPKYYATSLVHRKYKVDGGQNRIVLPAGKVLSAKAYPIAASKVDFSQCIDLAKNIGMVLTEDSYVEMGLTAYNRKRYFASAPRPVLDVVLPEHPYIIYITLQCEVTKHKYWGNFVDVLNFEAVNKFISLTHERYSRRYQEKFGKSIKAIFVDEVTAGWSSLVPEAFYHRYGYELSENMSALQEEAHPQHRQVKHQYYQLLYEMFCNAFEEPISNWCKNHGIYYCGEKPAMRFSQLKYVDIPGSDNGHKKAGAGLDIFQSRLRTNPRAVASAVYFYEKPIGLCECYHSLGWSGTLQDGKIIAEGLLLAGVQHLVPHGFFYSTHGLRKHDAPPSFFFQMPYWPLFSHLSNRVESICDLFKDTYIDANVLVFDANSGVPTREQSAAYSQLLELLAENHVDFHICDTDILTQGKINNGSLYIKDLRIDLIIIPPMEVIEPDLQAWIDQYHDAGGNLIHYHVNQNNEEFLTQVQKFVISDLILSAQGEKIKGLYTVKRKRVHDQRSVWFVLNTNSYEILVDIDSSCPIKEVALTSNLPRRLVKQEIGYQRKVKPYESFALIECNDSDIKPDFPIIQVLQPKRVKIKLNNKNLLRMNYWNLSLLDDQGQAYQTEKVPAIPLSNQLAIGNFMFSPTIKTYFGHEPELEFPQLNLKYQYQFEHKYNGQVELVMEPGSIGGDWKVIINNKSIVNIDHFTPSDAHVQGSLTVDITSMLQNGINTIEVFVTAAKPNHGLSNCLYLAGNFGVELSPVRLVDLDSDGKYEDYIGNKIPFYAGVIEYESSFMLTQLPQSESVFVEMLYSRDFNEACEVSINNTEFKPVLWQPRIIKIAVKDLRIGLNLLKTRVYTTLIRSFEGAWFDEKDHCYRELINHDT